MIGLVWACIFMTGCSCRPRFTPEAIERLRQGMEAEANHQIERENRRERVWNTLREKFDTNRDGRLSSGEEAAVHAHIEKVSKTARGNLFE